MFGRHTPDSFGGNYPNVHVAQMPSTMSVELIITCGLIVVGLIPLATILRSGTTRAVLLLLAAALGAGAWHWQKGRQQNEAHRTRLLAKAPREGPLESYVGSSTCRACHPHEFTSWHDSYHRTMTQYPSPENVRGNFDRVTLQFDGDRYHLEKDDQGYWVEMVDPDWKYSQLLKQAAHREGRGPAVSPEPNPPRTRLPITLMTGSHHMQTYWVPSRFGNLQFNLPFTYVFESQRWAPRHDVFLLNPDKHYSMQLWNTVCLTCHATAGQPRQDPKNKQLDSQAAEMGISCEACHGPGGEHVRANQSPLRRYAQHSRTSALGPARKSATSSASPEVADPTIFNPGRANHAKASETCGQCHAIRLKVDSADWFQHGLRFQAGQDLEARAPLVHYEDPIAPGTPDRKRSVMEGSFWNDGQVRVSGRDFNGLAASPCYQRGELSCLSCHSLHNYQNTAHQLAPTMESNAACLQCHNKMGANLEAHTHHSPGSSGSLCYNCHMPHTSYGLLKAIRSHKITSPTVRETIETGRPNACNLCHLDRPLAWTADHLAAWYQQATPPLDAAQTNVSSAALLLLCGDAGQRALIAWHAGWSEAIQAAGHDWLAPYLAELLVDPYSVVRYIAQRSLRRLPGFAQFDYDYLGPVEQREQARQRAHQFWDQQRASRASAPATTNKPGRSAVFIRPDGSLDEPPFRAQLRLRNDRKMELLE